MNARFKFSRIAMALLVLLVLVAATATPSLAAVPSDCKQTHTVKAGDYLSVIASTYKTTWQTLAQINQLKDPNLIYVGQVLCVSTTGTVVVPPSTPTSGSVQVYATSVVEDKSVTFTGKTLDVSSRYTVYMSNYKVTGGTQYLAGWVNTDKNGAFTTTLSIPKRLVDASLIKIVVINSRGDSANNWFINATASGTVGGYGTPGITLKVDDVDEGNSVKITVDKLPANVTFKVYIGVKGSEGADGEFVGLIRSTKGGKVTATFDIPDSLAGRSKLDILVESTHVDMSAFLTFDND